MTDRNTPCASHLLTLFLAVVLASCGRDEVIEQPVPLYGEQPIEYPLTLWDQRVEGETVLRVRVTEMGAVDSVEVSTSSGNANLDAAAVKGIRELRFQPGRRDGERVRVWVSIPVVFSTSPIPPEVD
jgi:protein TonB